LVARGFDHKAGRLTSDGPFPIASQVPYFRATGSVEASVAGGTLVWLDHPDRSQLAWFDREGHELSSVGPVLSSFNNVRLSADGRWAVIPVIDRARGILDIWTVEIGTGAVRKVSTSEATLDMPVISPDGDRIVCTKAGGYPPLALTMLMLREGGVPDKLPAGLPEGYSQLPSDWSPDGRFIAMTCNPFARDRQQNADVYLIDLARSGELVPLLVSQRQENGAVFAPDGRSIAFLSDESGRREVYVQPFDPEARRVTGNRRQISRGGAALVRWPRPGHEVFYLGADY
jgi:tricorn protease-like protein